MPSAAFEASLPFVLRWEGGFVDHPNDPGGRTNKGVTQKVYDAWRRRQGLPVRDVKRLEDAELHRIYEAGYWLPPRCDRLARQLDLVHFDTAVNMGPGRAVRFLQKAAGCGVDGDFGSQTEKAVQACELGDLIAGYCATREAYYRELVRRNASLGVFLKGWLNRLNALRHEIGLPGFEARPRGGVDEAGARRIPDIGEDAAYDF
ncbi:MAG: glycosyl hydrolase 108 family protein [Zoogloea sp.]|uniref:glycoside hydrolase family 108 protein n=1 Tax=Zoogloea sp. TaxID=49181 RepID=UPI0026259E5A|nr:glycosyl hydrolase 108 family protein [Zoogloea sp.]MDD3325937.1 glycosyl hydrolase 108 family protein [Zoogloea sp.]